MSRKPLQTYLSVCSLTGSYRDTPWTHLLTLATAVVCNPVDPVCLYRCQSPDVRNTESHRGSDSTPHLRPSRKSISKLKAESKRDLCVHLCVDHWGWERRSSGPTESLITITKAVSTWRSEHTERGSALPLRRHRNVLLPCQRVTFPVGRYQGKTHETEGLAEIKAIER